MNDLAHSASGDFPQDMVYLQKRLLWAESRLKAILHAEPECVKVISREGVFLEINEAGLAMLQASSLAEVQAQPLMDFVAPEYRSAAAELLRKVFAGEDAILEFDVIGLQGRRRWLELHATPLRNADGEVEAFLGVTRDLHERRQAEHDRDQLFNLSLDLLSIAGFDGVLKQVNPAWTKCLGWSGEELTSRPMLEFILPEDHAVTLRVREQVHHGKAVVGFENRYLCKDGTYRWLSWNVHPVIEIGQIFSVARDVTEHKLAERALQASEEQFSSAFEFAAIGIALVSPDGRFLKVNRALCQMVGYSEAELLLLTFQDITVPEDLEADLENVRQLLAGNITSYQMEKRYIHQQGQIIWILLSVSLVRDETGQPVHFISQIQDITAVKQATLEAQRVSKLLKAVADGTPDAVFVKDLQGRYLLFNEAASRFVGRSVEEVIGKDDTQLFGPEDARLVMQSDQAVMESGNVQTAEEVLTAAGVTRIYQAIKAPYRDAAGQVIGIIGISRDITQRKQVERQAREVQLYNQTLLDNSPQAIITYRASGEVVSANEACVRMLRVPDIAAVKMQNFRRIVFWQETGLLVAAEKALAAGQACELEAHGVNSFGKEIWLDCQLVPFTFVHEQYLLCFFDDIHERKQAEALLQEQAALLDIAHEAILVKDLEGHILYWNKGAERIYGWTANEVFGRVTAEFMYKDAEAFQTAFAELLERREWQGEFIKFTKSGREIVVETKWTLVFDQEDQPKSVLAIDTDITEKKKLESQLLRSQRMESIGTLAGGIAHDLNNVLAPILMSIEVLKENIRDDESLNVLETLQTSAQRGADLVKQVLTFARGVEGKRVSVNLFHVLRDIHQVVRETFPKNVTTTFQIPHDLWPVIGDPTQLHQVFMNLCVNARDAMPQGGKLIVSVQNIVLDEVYAGMYPESRPGSYVVVEVEDTGTGIPAAVRERIFEPFFTTKEIGKGTGLGLSTSTAIVRSHNGFINVYSEEGKGTKFKVYLPTKTTAQAADALIVQQSSLPQGNGELVLVVDDEEAIRGVARKILERFGYQVMLASHGAEAVSLYARYREGIALVITDMAMPVMDGPATVIALKAINPQIKIIGSSGHASNGGVAKALGAGVSLFIPKPYTAEKLLTTLAEALNEKN